MTATAVHIPTLVSERLTLRAPRLADFEHWAAFLASPRADFERGRTERATGYRTWAADAALWTLRGYGPFGLDRRDNGTYVGEVGIYQPEGYPGPELGRFLIPEAEGHGFASEAARAVMDWVRTTFGWPTLISFIDPRNTRSMALGLRLGGIIDPSRAGSGTGDVVIRHNLGSRS